MNTYLPTCFSRLVFVVCSFRCIDFVHIACCPEGNWFHYLPYMFYRYQIIVFYRDAKRNVAMINDTKRGNCHFVFFFSCLFDSMTNGSDVDYTDIYIPSDSDNLPLRGQRSVSRNFCLSFCLHYVCNFILLLSYYHHIYLNTYIIFIFISYNNI